MIKRSFNISLQHIYMEAKKKIKSWVVTKELQILYKFNHREFIQKYRFANALEALVSFQLWKMLKIIVIFTPNPNLHHRYHGHSQYSQTYILYIYSFHLKLQFYYSLHLPLLRYQQWLCNMLPEGNFSLLIAPWVSEPQVLLKISEYCPKIKIVVTLR